ncbi:thiol:disulfide interchange protein [Arcobacter suis]|uniref:Thiol:disulfide interchange protein n=1 Tax=Arcobacter suis CECT 7833 TaxID=663365 RepID=A0AAD0WQQ0_9BACT|nr:thioredoxin fold domain-containing protein [Arcobacter suis]AXX89971.1 thiol:disulfide interchange protein [Arcobacter suis CECT 7833]RWS47106.1 thiol:disulfide interchange protein [Arcobacter suis]
MFDFTKKVIISSLVLAGSLSADYKEVSKVEIAQMEQLELFKRAQIKINKAYDTGSLYILNISVQGNPDEIYLTKDKKLVLAGDVIDASNGMKITSPADVAPIRGKEAFVYGTGTEEYFLFTDPECKYCKMLESYLPKIQDKVKIRVFYYPLDSHTNAKDLSLYIMSQKTTDKKVTAMFDSTASIEKAKSMKYTQAELEKLEKQLDEQIQIGMKLNVQGTPTLFDKDGKNIIWVNLLEKFGIEVK